MTVKERILKAYEENPGLGSAAIAKIAGTNERYVRKVRENAELKEILDAKLEHEINIPNLKNGIKEILKKGATVKSIYDLADHFDTAPKKITGAIEELISEGYTLKLDNADVIFSKIIPKAPAKVLDVSKLSTGFYKFGVTSDNHLCSRYERLDVLHALYDVFEREGVKTVFNAGNWIDGEARFNKHDLIEGGHGLDNQLKYFLKHYPQREGIETRLITGDDHEGWYTQREGVDVGAYMQMKAREAGRNDLFNLGHMEADIILKAPKGQTVLRVLHPGGGSSYAVSYTSQKIVESYTGGEKPNILLVGHYHKAEYLFNRGVHIVQTGTTMDQSPFMRKKRLAAHLGGWVIEFAVDDYGAVTRFKTEWFPFYDTEYYNSRWGYKW